MQTNTLSPTDRRMKLLATATFMLKWTIILGAAQAFAALLIFSTFVNNYSYFRKAAQGDAAKFCAPYINQNHH